MNSLADTKTKLTDLTSLIELSEGSPEFVSELVTMFIRDLPDSINMMRTYCQNKEWDKLRAVAHKMKPSLSIIGLNNLQKEIQRIETSAAERSGLDKIGGIITKAHHAVEQVLEELKYELTVLKLK